MACAEVKSEPDEIPPEDFSTASMLSALEATQKMLRTVHGFSANGTTNKTPVSIKAVKVNRNKTGVVVKLEIPDANNSLSDPKPSTSSNSVVKEELDHVEIEKSSKATSETPKKDSGSFKETRHLPKDPKSGLTFDTVKRRELCDRFDQMLSGVGFRHRIPELPHLTNIQVAGLLRRSRNRVELMEVSDLIWNHVFDEKRRLDDRMMADPNFPFGKDVQKKMDMLKVDDEEDEVTDVSDAEEDGYLTDDDPFFIEINDDEDEDPEARQVLEDYCNFYETRRLLIQKEQWLEMQFRQLKNHRDSLQSMRDEVNSRYSPVLIEEAKVDPGEDDTQRCARCLPIKSIKKRKIVQIVKPISRNEPEGLAKPEAEDPLRELEDYLHLLSVDISEEDPDEYLRLRTESFSNKRSSISEPLPPLNLTMPDNQHQTRSAAIISEKKLLAQERAKAQAKRLAARAHHFKRGVGRPRKDGGHRSHRLLTRDYLPPKPITRRRPSNDKDRRSTLVAAAIVAQENASERRSFEEQLHRLSSGYVYSEITVPSYKIFDLAAEEEKVSLKTPRTPSRMDDTQLPGPSTRVIKEELEETNEALFFARLHHSIEYPKFTEEEIRQRTKDKWHIPIPIYRDYDPVMYQHEDPTNYILRLCTINTVSPPFESRFHPGILTEHASFIHAEPIALAPNKDNKRRGDRKRRHRSNTTHGSDSRSTSPNNSVTTASDYQQSNHSNINQMASTSCARARPFDDNESELLRIQMFPLSSSGSPICTPFDSALNTPSPMDGSTFSSASNPYNPLLSTPPSSSDRLKIIENHGVTVETPTSAVLALRNGFRFAQALIKSEID